jgi:hypothetical protein
VVNLKGETRRLKLEKKEMEKNGPHRIRFAKDMSNELTSTGQHKKLQHALTMFQHCKLCRMQWSMHQQSWTMCLDCINCSKLRLQILGKFLKIISEISNGRIDDMINSPAGHGVQAVVPAFEYVPAEHEVHAPGAVPYPGGKPS